MSYRLSSLIDPWVIRAGGQHDIIFPPVVHKFVVRDVDDRWKWPTWNVHQVSSEDYQLKDICLVKVFLSPTENLATYFYQNFSAGFGHAGFNALIMNLII